MNISNRKLNSSEISLLNKGLKLTPTPTIGNTDKLDEDLKDFYRKLRLVKGVKKVRSAQKLISW